MRILVTGATGFIGKRVVKELVKEGHEIIVLSRNSTKAALTLGKECKYYQWFDTRLAPPLEALKDVEGVINLMGEGIADKRWDAAQKKKIYDSRIVGTRNLIETLRGLEVKPKVLVSASAIGIYGDRGDEDITEVSHTANDFLGNLCKDWEHEANRAKELGIRVAIIRTGVVLGKGGGALAKMLPFFKMGIGGPIGSGKQYMSWIHVDDLVQMYLSALKDPSMEGVYNGTAPDPVTSREFAKELGKVIGRPAFMPTPAFALKLLYGEMSQVLLSGQKVLPRKFEQKKFQYIYPTLHRALEKSIY